VPLGRLPNDGRQVACAPREDLHRDAQHRLDLDLKRRTWPQEAGSAWIRQLVGAGPPQSRGQYSTSFTTSSSV
jgi:hypothetical protein